MTVSPALDRRFRDAAARSGLLDAGYGLVESPLGQLLVASSDRGILRISYDANVEEHVDWLSRVAGRNVLCSPRQVEPVRRELDEYFDGRRQAFDLSVDLREVTPFTERVLTELSRVPFGQTATYSDLATRAGNPKAARAVGMTMNRNPIPIVLPCHRVIGADGSLVGYAGGLERKVALLTLEGVLL
jgi:methylated-DNA-[protein]-cysteine S-methyltransferase